MKLQQATRLALYAVLELAANPDRQLSAADISERFGVSTNHLAKVLRDLGKARLVEAVRGAGGGYRFSGNAKRTTLMDIVALFEDVRSTDSESGGAAGKTPVEAAITLVLEEIGEIAEATLRSITIQTMLKIISEKVGSRDDQSHAN